MATIRFHLDEHVQTAVAIGLEVRRIDFTTTKSAGLISASDEEQLAFVLSEQRVLIAHDADFLRLHQAGRPHAGIAYCHQRRRSVHSCQRKGETCIVSQISTLRLPTCGDGGTGTVNYPFVFKCD